MIKKVFWSCTVLALASAGLIYVIAHHKGQPAVTYATDAVKGYASAMKNETKAIDWHSLQAQIKKEGAQVDLTPKPASKEDTGTFTLPEDIVLEAPDEIPVHIDINSQASTEAPKLPEMPATMPDIKDLPKRTMQPVRPRVMPYCEDDKPKPRMPYADEDVKTGSEEGSEPVADSKMSNIGKGDSPLETPFGQTDHDYHHHYPACPYTGRCAPSTKPETFETIKPMPKEAPESDKQSIFMPWGIDSLQKKLQGIRQLHKALQLEQELLPRRFDIDTMEARPMDVIWQTHKRDF